MKRILLTLVCILLLATSAGAVVQLTDVVQVNLPTVVNAKGEVSTNQTFDLTSYGSITMTVGAAIDVDLTGTYTNNKLYTTELVITNGGAYTITWAAKFKFVDGTAPTLTVSGRDTLTLITRDGGATCDVFVNGNDMK